MFWAHADMKAVLARSINEPMLRAKFIYTNDQALDMESCSKFLFKKKKLAKKNSEIIHFEFFLTFKTQDLNNIKI